MSHDLLQQIRDMQFADRSGAEALLLPFIRETFPLDVIRVELRPLAISLNSFNGFLTLADGQELFFKSHTETDTVIGEYYQAQALADASYPIIQPMYRSTEPGKQLLIYERIQSPSVFDVAWEIEKGNPKHLTTLQNAQHQSDDDLFRLYMQTLQYQEADDAAKSPVHQLFYHRLAGGRLQRFYGALPGAKGIDRSIHLPQGLCSMQEVRKARWIINGQHYTESLDDIIQRTIQQLLPQQAGISIIGHGDAHNGNVFLQDDSLLYFDPAFAGRHHPLLDLTKPMFHNVFAMWMYFPEVKKRETKLSLRIEAGIWHIEYDYAIPEVRKMFLESKVERVLKPVLLEQKNQQRLRADWRSYLKAALFCCPLLTMDLTDREKFSPEISLLGLAMAVEMGAESQITRSLIDQTLDDVELALK